MKTFKFIMLLIAGFVAISCGQDRSKLPNLPYYDYEDMVYTDEESVNDEETINIPYIEQDGVKYIMAKINGVNIDMIFDTGCSQTLISMLEAQMLKKKGLLTENDYIGNSKSIIADGSIVENMLFNIKSLELTDGIRTIVCENVVVQVSSNIEAPVLLGNEVLDRVASYTIDNENNIIKFKLKEGE